MTQLAKGTEATRDKIPWADVGPGWVLAFWSLAPGTEAGDEPPGVPTLATSAKTVYLVNPAGGRYLIKTFPPAPDAYEALVDWSGDGKRALLIRTGSSQRTAVTELDLASGATHEFQVDGDRIMYTRPSGKAILVSRDAIDNAPASLERVDPKGAHQLTLPTEFPGIGKYAGEALPTLDGTQLVMSAANGLALVSNGGTFIRKLSTGTAGSDCTPMRWWEPDQLLAQCRTESTTRLWLVPTSGAAATALTAPPKPPDFGGLNAWHVPTGTYVQAAGACGLVYLAKLNPDASTSPVTLPGVDNSQSVFVLGTDAGRLALQASIACGGGVSLLWFDPDTNATDVLLGPPVNRGGVIHAILYPTPSR